MLLTSFLFEVLEGIILQPSFSVWCSFESLLFEQSLECTAIAMAPAVLTVEADDNK